jgi:flagellin-like protein
MSLWARHAGYTPHFSAETVEKGEVLRVHLLNRHFSNRAVSQIIAALLLIAIAVAAAILLYVFSIGLLGSLGSGGGEQTKQQVIMEAYNFPIGGLLTITVRNVGTATVDMSGADFFLNGVSVTPDSGCQVTLTISGSCATALTVTTSSLMSGGSYPLKIVTPNGGVFSYPVTYGGAG